MYDFLQAILRFFKKTKPVPPPTEKPIEISVPDVVVAKPKRKKIAIIIGHGNGDSGAGGWNGVEEYNYNHKAASLVAEAVVDHEIKLFYRTSSGIVGVASRVVLWQPDISIELHCNAYNSSASGCEVLVIDGDSKSGELARSFAASFSGKFSRKLRGDKGVKWLSKSDRGYASLSVLKPVNQAILVEPFFIDNKEEWVDVNDYANFLTGWISKL
jgi:N-acetylmuramoyl-L-alanine amidase